ncbi:GGDEF domain-containing protein [Alteromonas portus]|uniref:diguanylate cyclase n=1 Tax=Alteromonas portus TaxID=2565549 RepID=A0A4U0ZIL7_9ALTE|nr:GGDEF domain-containing protein [Alteromonas portus]TKB03373.1 GGDEF domain-containing protein [Alteromonas portus]
MKKLFISAILVFSSAVDALSDAVFEYQEVAANAIMLAIVLAINLLFFFSLLTIAGFLSRKKGAALEAAETSANYDPLTALLNRRGFEAAMKKKEGVKGFLLIVDIDDFKQINDTYGHSHGDKVLKEISTRLSNVVRSEDVLARLGGEEFVLFICSEEEVEELADRLVKSVASKLFHLDIDINIQVTISVGAAQLNDFYTHYESAYEKADISLYEAKKQGKNQFAVSLSPCV